MFLWVTANRLIIGIDYLCCESICYADKILAREGRYATGILIWVYESLMAMLELYVCCFIVFWLILWHVNSDPGPGLVILPGPPRKLQYGCSVHHCTPSAMLLHKLRCCISYAAASATLLRQLCCCVAAASATLLRHYTAASATLLHQLRCRALRCRCRPPRQQGQ